MRGVFVNGELENSARPILAPVWGDSLLVFSSGVDLCANEELLVLLGDEDHPGQPERVAAEDAVQLNSER